MNQSQNEELVELTRFLNLVIEKANFQHESVLEVLSSVKDDGLEIFCPEGVLEEIVTNHGKEFEYDNTITARIFSMVRFAIVARTGSGYRYLYSRPLSMFYPSAVNFFKRDDIEYLSSINTELHLRVIRGIECEEELKDRAVPITFDDKGCVNKAVVELVNGRLSRAGAVNLSRYIETLANRVIDIAEAALSALPTAYEHSEHTIY